VTSHPRDDLAAYALGALDAQEERAVRAHVDGCDSCRADVRAFGEAVWALAETAQRDAPASLRAAIVARARRYRPDVRRRDRLAVLVDAFLRPVPLAVPVALAVLLAVALSGYGAARRDADRYAAALSGVVGARVVTLAPTGEFPGVRGSLVVPANGAAPYLVLDLPAAPSAKTWEAWIIRGETPLAAGITDERGVTTLVLTAPLGSGDTVAVTLEPSGGVERVTGKPVLAGKT
jgi:anti-sigma-K factor RskA